MSREHSSILCLQPIPQILPVGRPRAPPQAAGHRGPCPVTSPVPQPGHASPRPPRGIPNSNGPPPQIPLQTPLTLSLPCSGTFQGVGGSPLTRRCKFSCPQGHLVAKQRSSPGVLFLPSNRSRMNTPPPSPSSLTPDPSAKHMRILSPEGKIQDLGAGTGLWTLPSSPSGGRR